MSPQDSAQHSCLPRQRLRVPREAPAHTHGGALISFSSLPLAGRPGLASTRGLPPRARFLHGWHLNRRLGLWAAATDAELSAGWAAPPPPQSRGLAGAVPKHPLSALGPEQGGAVCREIRDAGIGPGIWQFNCRFDFHFQDRNSPAQPHYICPPSGLGCWMRQELDLVPGAWTERLPRRAPSP